MRAGFDIRNLDRRLIYALVFIALAAPLYYRVSLPPARMKSAEKFYDMVETTEFKRGDIALVLMDFGPNSKAENQPQTEVVIEHLMRRRIPFAVTSSYAQAEGFLETIPTSIADRLNREIPEGQWSYGKDWINLGFRPGGFNLLKSISSTANLVELLKSDARGNDLSTLPAFQEVRTLRNIRLVAQLTSLVGTLEPLLQFLKSKDYRPEFVHGCTSITIPQAYIYLDSGQLRGLLEGVPGAAWYSGLLSRSFPGRAPDEAQITNTGLGVAHLVIIFLVLLGNAASFLLKQPEKDAAQEAKK